MKKLLMGILVIALLLAGIGFFLPTSYRIEEYVMIRATPVQIHDYVGELKKWDEWTPWLAEDPTIVTTHGDKTTGVGASQSWTGKDGDGELTFTKCDPMTGIAYDMAFITGETRAPAVCEMIYEAKGEKTKVIWTMEGDVGDFMPPVLAGYMNIAMKMQISSMFEQGLETLMIKVEN